VRSKA